MPDTKSVSKSDAVAELKSRATEIMMACAHAGIAPDMLTAAALAMLALAVRDGIAAESKVGATETTIKGDAVLSVVPATKLN